MSSNHAEGPVAEGAGPASSVELPPQLRLLHVVDTMDQLEGLNDGGNIAVDFLRWSRRGIHIAFEGGQSPSLSVWTTETRTGFRTRPKRAADLFTIRFVNSGAMSHDGPGSSDIVVGFDQALFTSFEDMRFEWASPGFSSITATVSRDVMMKGCQALGGSDSNTLPRFATVVDPHTPALAALRRTIGLLRDRPMGPTDETDLITPLLQELLVYQFISAWPTIGGSIGSSSGDVADRPVRAAIDCIEANLRRKIEIAEIAGAAGLSVRLLQFGFKRRLGCSPVQYLIGRRLDRVHSELQTFDGLTVQQVAREWGFSHMSDFNRRYRDRFGHTPGRLDRSTGRRSAA
jgi:AraC-like DNA-binding protein